MIIMSLLSIERTRKECFVLVGEVNCFGVIVPSSSNITECRLGRWEDLMEYTNGLLVTLENKRSSRDANIDFNSE